jgi:hypothetical protein
MGNNIKEKELENNLLYETTLIYLKFKIVNVFFLN